MTHTVEHTPGPWTIKHAHPKASNGGYWYYICGPDGQVPAVLDYSGNEPENYGETSRADHETAKQEAAANARLIAAAPELLAALQDCLPDLEHYVRTHGPGPDKRLDQARAALSKAKGQP